MQSKASKSAFLTTEQVFGLFESESPDDLPVDQDR
jgi:hypothetical protein